ncbi:L-threonylcarbamoyladenylate synthase [Blattabacterium cuenoti]|uniref:L-threonylcarbamoyladenylate synthase n=1 Tax=Blattabacterium cuenoti TaxID=1653831 RepID=UPI00163CE680|nr:L-threonylcarbamoyladenylate synthase [Blattabacterium cuenoti]
MSFYKEVEISVEKLKNGKILLYPTDTIWGLGCDAFNINAIKKIYKIKNRKIYKPMILLVENIDRLYSLVGKISDFNIKIISDNIRYRKKPITIIYDHIYDKKIPNLLFSRNDYHQYSIAIRLTNDPFCAHLIKKLDKPIISTSANISGYDSPRFFYEISYDILKNVDYAVNIRRNEQSNYANSSIIKIISKKIKILRT